MPPPSAAHDRRYMIKTISGGECKFLRTILPSYLEHIKANPHTLLTRFYGMHRVKVSERTTGRRMGQGDAAFCRCASG